MVEVGPSVSQVNKRPLPRREVGWQIPNSREAPLPAHSGHRAAWLAGGHLPGHMGAMAYLWDVEGLTVKTPPTEALGQAHTFQALVCASVMGVGILVVSLWL